MKKLVFEDSNAILYRQKYADELVKTLNGLLDKFIEKHNPFSQPVNEAFVFQLFGDPLGTFDKLLWANASFKPALSRLLDPARWAELVHVNRQGFIDDFTIVLPGTRNQHNREGVRGMMTLTIDIRHLVAWDEDHFIINEQGLSAESEAYRIYAETDEQLAEVDYWEKMATTLNTLLERKIIQSMDARMIADKIPMIEVNNSLFRVKSHRLASVIREMVAA